jgi:hypothetical protein
MTITVDLVITGGTTATTPELKEIQARVGTRLCQLADNLSEGNDGPTSIAMACMLLEEDFEALQLAKVDYTRFGFEAVATHAILNMDDPRQMRDEAFRAAFTEAAIELVQMTAAPLEREYKARLAVTRLAETRIAARLDLGAGVTPEIEAEEYSAAAAFVLEQTRAAPHRTRRKPNFSIDAE